MASRVRWLIDQWYGGNVNKAARSIGMPQRTLAVIASGQVKQPRTGAVLQIAAHFHVSLDWLVRGNGAPPVPEQIARPTEGLIIEHTEAERVLAKLKSPAAAAQALRLMCMPVIVADVLLRADPRGRTLDEVDAEYRVMASGIAEMWQQKVGWSRLLDAAIERLGAERVSLALASADLLGRPSENQERMAADLMRWFIAVEAETSGRRRGRSVGEET